MQAMARDFSEPLIWQDSAHQLRKFEALIANHGLRLLQGGRFVHVIGACDKGKCLHWLRKRFTDSYGATPLFVALGDSQNDVAHAQCSRYCRHSALFSSRTSPILRSNLRS